MTAVELTSIQNFKFVYSMDTDCESDVWDEEEEEEVYLEGENDIISDNEEDNTAVEQSSEEQLHDTAEQCLEERLNRPTVTKVNTTDTEPRQSDDHQDEEFLIYDDDSDNWDLEPKIKSVVTKITKPSRKSPSPCKIVKSKSPSPCKQYSPQPSEDYNTTNKCNESKRDYRSTAKQSYDRTYDEKIDYKRMRSEHDESHTKVHRIPRVRYEKDRHRDTVLGKSYPSSSSHSRFASYRYRNSSYTNKQPYSYYSRSYSRPSRTLMSRIKPIRGNFIPSKSETQFDSDVRKAYLSILGDRCTTDAFQKNEHAYPFIGATFYENIINFCDTTYNLSLADKIGLEANHDEATRLLTQLVNVSILGFMAGKWVFNNDMNFDTAPPSYPKMGLTTETLKQCTQGLYSTCANAQFARLPTVTPESRYSSSSSRPSRQSSYDKSSSSYEWRSKPRYTDSTASTSAKSTNNIHQQSSYYHQYHQQQQAQQYPYQQPNHSYWQHQQFYQQQQQQQQQPPPPPQPQQYFTAATYDNQQQYTQQQLPQQHEQRHYRHTTPVHDEHADGSKRDYVPY